MQVGKTGAASNEGATSGLYSRNNRFTGNTYLMPDVDGQSFQWREKWLTWAQWQVTGNDTEGSFQ
jgi:hypothetical protein